MVFASEKIVLETNQMICTLQETLSESPRKANTALKVEKTSHLQTFTMLEQVYIVWCYYLH